MHYKQQINNIEALEYSRYADITSNEKLMVFAAYTLAKMNIPLTFNYICIAAFKLFPDKFCCDDEFREFPSVDRLNRTMMHLKYTENPLLVGSVDRGYTITNYGKACAISVESIINNSTSDSTIKAPTVDAHKKGSGEYSRLISTQEFKDFTKTKSVDEMFVWSFFKAIPFTQIKRIKDNLELIKNYAKNAGDRTCLDFIKAIEETI